MNTLLIFLLTFISVAAQAKEFLVTIQEIEGKQTIATINLPSDNVIVVDGEESKCFINSFAFDLTKPESILALEMKDYSGNRASSAELYKKGFPSVITMNNNRCIVEEVK